MSYNGWSNYETWNVSLWLNNEEGTHKELQSLQRRAYDKESLAKQIEDLCKEIWSEGKTPDGADLNETNWLEIAESEWQEDEETEGVEVSTPSSLSLFITANHITMEARRVSKRPDSLMGDSARHFRCIFHKHNEGSIKHSAGVYFSQGSAYIDLPTVEDVLDCLASDASGYENVKTFEDWAGEYGYDTDSRQAEKTFKLVKRSSDQLKRFLGKEAYETLLYKTERL